MKSIFSFLLIGIFLAGTAGINFDTHYCCGKKMDSEVSIIPQILSCGMAMEEGTGDDDHESIDVI